MALLDSEASRIKAELGYSVLTSGAIPYRDVWNTFDLVIKDYVQSGATTTCATPVTKLDSGELQQVTLSLADATGFASNVAVVIDVDARQERATSQNLSGTALTVLISGTHSGTYPVTVEGGESIVRGFLRRLVAISTRLEGGWEFANLKRVDEVEFHAPGLGGMDTSSLAQLRKEQSRLRNELARVLNVPNMNGGVGRGTSRLALY